MMMAVLVAIHMYTQEFEVHPSFQATNNEIVHIHGIFFNQTKMI